MAVEIRLPKIGFTMTEGHVAEWLARSGDAVEEGQPLYLLESAKATNEIAAPAAGRLRIVAQVGETFGIGALLGYID